MIDIYKEKQAFSKSHMPHTLCYATNTLDFEWNKWNLIVLKSNRVTVIEMCLVKDTIVFKSVGLLCSQ